MIWHILNGTARVQRNGRCGTSRVAHYCAYRDTLPGAHGRIRCSIVLLSGFVVLMLAASMPLVAQPPVLPMRPAGGESCDGKIVSAVSIRTSDPSFQVVPRPLRGVARVIGMHYVTTKPDVIASYVLLKPGDICTDFLRGQSEHLLRQQTFVAEASVRAVAVADSADHVNLEVITTDEIPIVVGVGFNKQRPAALTLGHANLAGRGLYLAAGVERGFAYRTGVSLEISTTQLLGKPITAALEAERAPLESTFQLSLQRPFLAEEQRFAWHVGFGDVRRYVSYVRGGSDAASLDVDRRYWDAGVVRRVGHRSRGLFAGGLVTFEDVAPATRTVVISDSGLLTDTSNAFATIPSTFRNARLNAVFGLRSLRFTHFRGSNALGVLHDLASGVQFGGMVGRGIAPWGSSDDDLFLAGDLYLGTGSFASFASFSSEVEARRDRALRGWSSVVASARMEVFKRTSPRNLISANMELAGGWRERLPLQLLLGDHEGGIRGYGSSRDAGTVRSVARLENRFSLGNITPRAALGVAAFVDAGRVWAGDAPFTVDSKTKVGVGVGLLAAFPPESRRVWRLDVALPVSEDQHAKWEVRFSTLWSRSLWREPRDVVRMRSRSAPSSIFAWPP